MKPVALITGVSRGIGFAFAKYLLDQEWKVIGICRNKDKLSLSGQIQLYEMDVRDETQIQSLSQKLAHQPIDLLINNAGILNGKQNTCWGKEKESDYSPSREELLEVLEVNSVSPIRIITAFIPQLLLGKRKQVVSLSSGAGSISQNESGKHLAYRMSKAALNMGMKVLSYQLQDKGIHFLSLSPGWVQTAMGGKSATTTPEESVQKMMQVIENKEKFPSGGFFNPQGEKILF